LGKNAQNQTIMLDPILPSDEVLNTKRIAFHGRSQAHIKEKLQEIDPLLTLDNAYNLESLYPNNPGKVASLRTQIDLMLDSEHVLDLQRILMRTGNWSKYYKETPDDAGEGFAYYQVRVDKFKDPDNDLMLERTREELMPWIAGVSEEYHKYTVVAWLEGDDPQCTNDLMGSAIGMNFQIVEVGADFNDTIGPGGTGTVTTEPSETETTT
jgi:hypothetical protein